MILLVDKIEKSFGARVLFSGASFQSYPGERFALVGPNGAGKTTMLKIIMGKISDGCGGAWREMKQALEDVLAMTNKESETQ